MLDAFHHSGDPVFSADGGPQIGGALSDICIGGDFTDGGGQFFGGQVFANNRHTGAAFDHALSPEGLVAKERHYDRRHPAPP